MTKHDFENLELQIKDLEQDHSETRGKYTDEQIKDIGKLQDRYAAFSVKKGLNDFGNQMEGFIEGIKSDTNNKTNENE